MSYRVFCAFFLVLFLWVPTHTYAKTCTIPPGICDDIADVSDGWNTVADILEEYAGEELGDLDTEGLAEVVYALLEPSALLGAALIELGNEDEVEMGELLIAVLEELGDVEEDDYAGYLVDRLDDIVTVMDFIVAYCDEE